MGEAEQDRGANVGKQSVGGTQSELRGALPAGTVVGAYEVEALLGHGGYGVVYRARQVQLGQVVALKEYLPVELAVREGGRVYPRSRECRPHYEDGRRRFLEEARCLTQFRDDPGVVACLNYFSANGTAYMVLEHVEGLSLAALLREREAGGRPLEESELRALLLPLLASLERLHGADVLHRDIKPSNVLVRRLDGRPVLIDFGAAKQQVALQSKSVAPYTEGYAALEQVSAGELGPWTDVYGLGAVLWRVVAGGQRSWEPPEPPKVELRAAAVLSGERDPLPAAVDLGAGRFSAGLLGAIDGCLRIQASDRISNCSTLRKLVEGSSSGTESRPRPSRPRKNDRKIWQDLRVYVALMSLILVLIALWPEDGGTRLDSVPDASASPEAVKMLPDAGSDPNARPEAGTPAPDSSVQTAERQNEGLFWESIQESTNRADYEAYLQQYPEGSFAVLARNRLQELSTGRNSAPDASAQTVDQENERLAVLEQEKELAFWQTIMESTDRTDYEAYLQQYPEGSFAVLARKRLQELAAGRRPEPGGEVRSAAEARIWRAGEVFRDCAGCPELVVIPGGRFRMGCVSGQGCYIGERPVHEVEVGSFALGVYEVTFEEYDRFARATGRRLPSDFGWGRGGRPVINVSWNDAQAYVEWLSGETGAEYRLPSEAEWEYAARAGTETAYWWGGEIGRNRANCDGCGSAYDGKRTAPTGSFEANGWGLHEMAGNVWEWVADCWHGDYAGAPGDGTAWLGQRGGDCGLRVLRGGAWNSNPRYLRSAHRSMVVAGIRGSLDGFRVSRALD